MSKISIIQAETEITVGEARFNPASIEKLDNLFLEHIRKDKIQAAGYLLARAGKIFAHKTMGRLYYPDPTKPYLPDSLRWVASVTKICTAVALMQLLEEGLLYLEQPVADIIPEFKSSQHSGITLFHLLTHTSGLKADSGYFLETYPEHFELEDAVGLIHHILSGPLQSRPGECWSYSTLGFNVLGEVITRVSGLPYEEYISRHILQPLGMRNSWFHVPPALSARVCLVSSWEVKRNTDLAAVYSPGNGLSSTPYDLFLLGQMLLNKGIYKGVRILGRKTVEAMTRNQLGDHTPAFHWGRRYTSFPYGLGLALSQKNLMSPGTFLHEGYGRCGLYMDPIEELLAVYLVPSDSDWDDETLENPRAVIWGGIE